CVEQDDKGWDARKRAYCLKIQPATGSFARNLIYSTKPHSIYTRHTSSCMYCDSNYLEYINIKIRKWQTNPGQEKKN
ncbi:hypothetical protein, partial [Escherichia coli]|uniref:hypothetical protein n=1 Tax=Escherichia coli TaxID=562 RepID=UPI001ABBFBC3